MNRPALLCLPLVLALAAFSGPLPPPLEPAGDGKLLCLTPDREQKTCRDLIRYSLKDASGLEALTVAILEEAPLVVWEGSAPVEVKHGRVCDRSRPEHAQNYNITVADGAPAQTARLFKQFMIAATQALNGHEMCMELAPEGDGLLVHYWFDGKRSKLPDEPAIWVAPAEGYRVAL